jgi:glutathione peroxidase
MACNYTNFLQILKELACYYDQLIQIYTYRDYMFKKTHLLACWLLSIIGVNTCYAIDTVASSNHSFYNIKVKTIDGEEISLDKYKGQVLLVVNTATRCGFSGQLNDLNELYLKYKDRGFSVLAFPSNDFGSQEPGANNEVKAYCTSNFEINYPMFEKNPVKGIDKQPVYKFLTELSAPKFQGDPGWNFVKFLIDRNGNVVERFSSMTNPLSSSVINSLEEVL